MNQSATAGSRRQDDLNNVLFSMATIVELLPTADADEHAELMQELDRSVQRARALVGRPPAMTLEALLMQCGNAVREAGGRVRVEAAADAETTVTFVLPPRK